jgi:hypothetical protein
MHTPIKKKDLHSCNLAGFLYIPQLKRIRMKVEISLTRDRGNSKNFCWTRRDFFYDKQRHQSSPEFSVDHQTCVI